MLNIESKKWKISFSLQEQDGKKRTLYENIMFELASDLIDSVLNNCSKLTEIPELTRKPNGSLDEESLEKVAQIIKKDIWPKVTKDIGELYD